MKYFAVSFFLFLLWRWWCSYRNSGGCKWWGAVQKWGCNK